MEDADVDVDVGVACVSVLWMDVQRPVSRAPVAVWQWMGH